MANNKDNNADLGNQTIEGTQPPIILDAVVVTPEANDDVPSAAELDEQLAKLMSEPEEAPSVITPPPPATPSDEELDAQLAALIAETNDVNASIGDIDKLNAQIDAILNDQEAKEAIIEPVEEPVITPVAPEEDQPVAEPEPEAIIISAPPPATEEAATPEPTATETPTAVEQPIIPEPIAAEETKEPENEVLFSATVENEKQPEPPISDAAQQAEAAHSAQADEARAMLEQTKRLMEQIQAQAQATARQEFEDTAARRNADEKSLEMMREAQMMLQQARQEQARAQQALQMQQNAAHSPYTNATADPYQPHEVDKLKSELDGMRELVNRLTFTISQLQGSVQQPTQIPQMPYMYATQQPRRDSEDREQFKKLETELERMRREIMEKDLRDREKELDRRQKEAESSTVKDIRPEMIQMSDSRDNVPVPMGGANGAVGGEFIPLANGVYYSIKDKQVYVMTPASNAAAASPTIEPKRPAPAPRRAAPKKRPVAAHRRPVAPGHRRPLHRPTRPGHR